MESPTNKMENAHINNVPLISGIVIIALLCIMPYLLVPSLRSASLGQPILANPYVQDTLDQRLVFTYYFYWYDWATGQQMYGANGSECPDLNYFHPYNKTGVSFLDPNWHYREFSDMMLAGIDVYLPVYWGPLGWSLNGLAPMEQAMNQLKQDNANANNIRNATNPVPKVGLFFDTTSMKSVYHHFDDEGNMITDADLSNETHRETFYQFIKVFFSQFSEDNIQQIVNDEEPSAPTAYIVWLFLSDFFVHTPQSCFDYCKARFQEELNHTLLFVGTPGWVVEAPAIEGVYYWMSSLKGATYYEESPIRIAGIGPGYHNGNATTAAVCQVDQEQIDVGHTPELYQGNWTAAIDLDPNWIVIETWNELLEGTSICRTDEYGDTYIQINGENSYNFHNLPIKSHWRGVDAKKLTSGLIILAIGVGITAGSMRAIKKRKER